MDKDTQHDVLMNGDSCEGAVVVMCEDALAWSTLECDSLSAVVIFAQEQERMLRNVLGFKVCRCSY
jgi:hypothetical protein